MLVPLVVVGDFYVPRTIVSPAEADSPLIIDSDTVLSPPIATEFFQPVTWRHAQIVQTLRAIKHLQLSFSLCPKGTERSPNVADWDDPDVIARFGKDHAWRLQDLRRRYDPGGLFAGMRHPDGERIAEP
jgi:hypothetical protein